MFDTRLTEDAPGVFIVVVVFGVLALAVYERFVAIMAISLERRLKTAVVTLQKQMESSWDGLNTTEFIVAANRYSYAAYMVIHRRFSSTLVQELETIVARGLSPLVEQELVWLRAHPTLETY